MPYLHIVVYEKTGVGLVKMGTEIVRVKRTCSPDGHG
jgi:hypothetical protein